ncbi:MAG: hypothetical protein M1839_005264 [Geoglossum umbratile]|nr:MAG: hypothetical protein M1839_005264 [Geoglossum umbratile]
MDAIQAPGHTAAQSGKTIKETLGEELDELLKIFNNSCDLDEIMSEMVFEAWNYIQSHRLWTIRYQDLESLRRDIQYNDFVAMRIDYHKAVTSRKRAEGMNIYETWGCFPQDAFPDNINPPWFSDHLLRGLNQLSRHCSLKEALSLLRTAMKDRLDDSDAADRSKFIQYLTPNDVTKALKRIKYGGGELAKQANTGESPMTMNILGISDPLGEEGAGARTKVMRQRLPTPWMRRGPMDSTGEGEQEDEQTKTKEVPRAGKMKMKARTTRTKPLAKDDEVKAADSMGEEEQDEQIKTVEVLRAGKMETKARTTMIEPPAKVLQCGCASICSAILPRIPPAGVKLDKEEGLGLLERSHDLQWANFCKNHLRRLAGGGLDMWIHSPSMLNGFFNRFAGRADAWDIFQEDGTINIDGAPEHILKPEIFDKLEEEFDMYLYHLRDEQDGRKRRGRIRHMFYSLVQQLVRQDPVYYALITVTRPDQNTWLICYPYYVKYQVEGESTGFAHLDINVDKFVETGWGKDIIQGSLSLDDENDSGYTTNAKKTYLLADQQDSGRLVPVPCKRGTVRITIPEILHGSTPFAKNIRRTLFNWCTGIRADHQKLDIEEAETWNQVAQCHQSMEAPMKSTSGEGFRYGRPLFPFPGVTKLRSTSYVGDALIGARRRDDLRVQDEWDILLGASDGPALQLAEKIRERLVQAFFDAFPYVRMNEERAYRDRSYFHNKYRPRPEAERDGSSFAGEELSSMSLVDNDQDMKEIEEGDRTLRTLDGTIKTVREIALDYGREDLAKLFEPRYYRHFEEKTLASIEMQLHQFMREYAGRYLDKHCLRMPQLSVLMELKKHELWIPIPHMYEGFLIELREETLHVTLFETIVGATQQKQTDNKDS